jgi:hypothetical protein
MFLFLAASVTAAGDLVSYQASGWRYQQVDPSDPLIATFYATSFDDSGWSTAQGAFGNFGELDAPPPFCEAVYTVHTQWDLSTDVLLRRYFVASPTLPVTIYLSIDNDATIYVNGIQLLDVVHEHCPLPDDFQVTVPQAYLAPSGSNLLAIRAHDRGFFSFVDARVEGEQPPLAINVSTWGAIKALYR